MEGSRSRRAKRVSTKMSEVTEEDKQQAVRARLDALENDEAEEAFAAAGSDDEYQLEDSDEEMLLGDGKKRKRKKSGGSAKRKTRQAATEQRGPRTFAACLEAADLDEAAPPNYLTAAAGPPRDAAPRAWCSVCGFAAPYKCVRCASRFCSRKCLKVHAETRCLKFAI